MKVVAHRGGRGFGIDNTLEAMETAVRSGVKMMETDVRETADGRLIICHDAMVWGHIVGRATYDEIKKHTPDRPLLSQVLERLAGWVTLNLEIKEARQEPVGEMIEAYGIEHSVLVTSFHRGFLERFKELFPSMKIGHLYRMGYGDEKKLLNALAIGAQIILPYYHSIDRKFVENAHRLGLEVYAWTVNNEHDLIRLYDWGVDAVITDRYLEFVALLRGMEEVTGAV